MSMDEKLVHELRQGYGLAASFYRAAAARLEMTETEIQVIDLLESSGEATAGQLAHFMGLTTGTFTAILNRLEKAGLIQRERDPNDGRRVIVRLVTGSATSPLFASLEQAWAEMAAHYNAEQKAWLLQFLQDSNTLTREEIARLREAAGEAGVFSAPQGDLASARLVFHCEGIQLHLRAADLAGALYQARFEGTAPGVKVKDGLVTIRYPRRLWDLGKEQPTAELTLSTALPWQIALKGGGAQMTAELDGLDLIELEAEGAGSVFRVDLPEPAHMVPIRLSGSGSEFTVRRPRGVAARVHLQGWGSGIVFDNQPDTGMSTRQSANYEGAARRYDIEMSGTGSMITIAAG